MERVNRLLKIRNAQIVAVIRGSKKSEALDVSRKLLESGIKSIEVTLTTPNALEIVTCLKQEYQNQESIIGAGTVLDKESALLFIQAGAEFIVSPVFDVEVCSLCHLYQIPYIPGCMTVNEMKNALVAGVDIVKLFPSNQFEPTIISSIHAPLPQVTIMPSGGVNSENLLDWFQAGAEVVSVGGELTDTKNDTTLMAQRYIEKLKELSK
ncbi:bifunctional 2-keto-4-hydroxyglutarate aldolase/2-keto-3-deoxy-6-phosphogluconate aldolase [Vagococcus carniphilus]|uniref:bifunctional 2-keto-4-hydroxyglutarate aldolase/2-keto-3-deoxy-6-phosphogluconate aldolase n=1 Tax=Vagococcus carniphilus TaxID=218144 RepID=UPI003BAC7B15